MVNISTKTFFRKQSEIIGNTFIVLNYVKFVDKKGLSCWEFLEPTAGAKKIGIRVEFTRENALVACRRLEKSAKKWHP